MENKLTEKAVVQLWQRLLLNQTELFTESGEPLRIIYPGRVNSDRGADFRDAVIATNHGLRKGDIEVHVNASGWQAHRHHRDPHYNRVILHVVMWPNNGKAATCQNGQGIPVLALHKYLDDRINHSPLSIVEHDQHGENPPEFLPQSIIPCREAAARLPARILSWILERAGEERFRMKAIQFQTELTQMETGQALYQGIMEALGYTKNKLPFLELSRKLPLQTLEAVVTRLSSNETRLIRQQALLFGTAGLLPSQRQNSSMENSNDRWVNELERWWASSGHTAAMSAGDWCLFKVRPNNSPLRRIAAVSHIILRYQGKDILLEMVKMVEEISSGKLHGLASPLIVTSDGYWASHFDFGTQHPNRNPTLVGTGRAADIVVNVVLPLTLAWSKINSQPELGRKALNLYRHHPRLASNTLERHMREQLGPSGLRINSARQQQGLIHLYHTRCIQGKCYGCPLSQPEPGNHVQVQTGSFTGAESVVTARGNHSGIIGT